jgi:hypothetical protein
MILSSLPLVEMINRPAVGILLEYSNGELARSKKFTAEFGQAQ